jgi:hypothetical protein
MTYTAYLDITAETSFSAVKQFAEDHGCIAELIKEFGPGGGNPLYRFSSDNIHYITELTEQLGYTPAEDFIEEV